MNTTPLKKFAREARQTLLQQIATQLDYVVTTDSGYLRERAVQLRQLKEAIAARGKERVIAETAYLWFNRFVALRFMDVNDYADLRAVSPAAGGSDPELLELARAGQLPDDLKVDRRRIYDLLDGKLPSPDAPNEVYRLLLVAECNRRHRQLPFLFQRLEDYSSLLLPSDLLSGRSFLADLRKTITPAYCENEEVIGWLYQFYIADKKDAVFAAKGKVKKEDIPAVTQLFTPRWIVEYMVQNTLGKLWLHAHPESRLRERMEYYIESEEEGEGSESGEEAPPTNGNGGSQIVNRKSSIVNPSLAPEELSLADQACGSGHILLYAFELLTAIYEEAGYPKSDIPGLVLEHNLTGFEIDPRAAQLAGFTLMMRARRYHRSALRKGITPHIVCFRDLPLTEAQLDELATEYALPLTPELLRDLDLMRQATNLGTLIVPAASKTDIRGARTQVQSELEKADLFGKNELRALDTALEQLAELKRKFWCVVDNPPYMGSNMNASLKKFVKAHYPLSKSDLMATFMERGLAALPPGGYLGMINQHSWMFLSSYEKLRKHLLDTVQFDTILHLGPRAFPEIGGEVVQSTAFTFATYPDRHEGTYFRLVDDGSTELKRDNTRAAIQNPALPYCYRARQENFSKIPGSPIGYWLDLNIIKLFHRSTIGDRSKSAGRTKTHHDLRFVRMMWEISQNDLNNKYRVFNKGGDARTWFGNLDYVVLWTPYSTQKYAEKGGLRNEKFDDTEGITWSDISSSKTCFRIKVSRSEYASASPTIVTSKDDVFFILGYLNSSLCDMLMKIINPTFHANVGDVLSLPLFDDVRRDISTLSEQATHIAEFEWNNNASTCNAKCFLLAYTPDSPNFLFEAFQIAKRNSTNAYLQLHSIQEDINNRTSICAGLDHKYVCQPLQDITILQEELDRKALAKLNKKLTRDPATGLVTNYDELELPFKRDVILQQFISYAVGCMMGRYSLDREGLILANAGDTLAEYAERVGKGPGEWTFAPDEDGILPILAGEYFPDDIVGRFRAFLKAAFSEQHFAENLAFVEECIGKDIRKYFVRDFYKDHVKRYKKRPIYWCFASPGGHFRALVYLHRYRPDTVSRLLNDYLRPFIAKLEAEREAAIRTKDDASLTGGQRTRAAKVIEQTEKALRDCRHYADEILYPLAQQRLPLDLDDGVLVNYNRMGEAVETIPGVNDPKKREKVLAFDWVVW